MAFLDGKIAAIIFTVIEFVVLAFTVIGTPLAQFIPRYGTSWTNGGWYTTTCSGLLQQGLTNCQNQLNTWTICTSSKCNGSTNYNACVNSSGCAGYNQNQYNACVANVQSTYGSGGCGSGSYYAGGYSASSCFTMWGFKWDCGSTTYNARGTAAFGCGQRKNNMTGAAVFAIVSIAFVLVAFLYGLLLVLGCCRGYLLPAIMTLIAVATLLVCWACVAGVYNNNMCNCTGCAMSGKLKNNGYAYGPGFALIVSAWCFQVVNCVFVFVLMFV